MGLRQTFSNPFYFLLILAGLVFSITACAYGVMTVRGLRPLPLSQTTGPNSMQWIDENGFWLMLVELAVLGVFCVLAITTDSYWEKRQQSKSN